MEKRVNDPSPFAQAAPLDYATPQATRRLSVARLIVGLLASLLAAIGCALVVFGIMIGNHFRDESATFTSIGIGLIVTGIGVVASWFFARPQ
jgi:hypothetical protein